MISCFACIEAAETVDAEVLVYSVEDKMAPAPYLSRIMVTDEFLRMDEVGEQALPGFLLFDRLQRQVLSVNPLNKSVMVIDAGEEELEKQRDIDLAVKEKILAEAPAVAGKQPIQYDFEVTGHSCFTLVAVPGQMDDSMLALREMQEVLSMRHRRVVDAFSDADCKLPIDAYRPGIEYSRGLVLTLIGKQESRQLVEFESARQVDRTLFEEPMNYRRMAMP